MSCPHRWLELVRYILKREPLCGLQVRHTAEEVGAGETVILTLADKGVLDEDDADELENVLAVRTKGQCK